MKLTCVAWKVFNAARWFLEKSRNSNRNPEFSMIVVHIQFIQLHNPIWWRRGSGPWWD